MKNSVLALCFILLLFSCNQESIVPEEDLNVITLKAGTNKIEICHYNPHNHKWMTKWIPEKHLPRHLEHGDKKVACGYTFIPDTNFESKLIELGKDDVLDNRVLTESIQSIDELIFFDPFNPEDENNLISDLTGIEDFHSLKTLFVVRNTLTSIDLSNNKELTSLDIDDLYSESNLTTVDLSNNTKLKTILIYGIPLSELELPTSNHLISLELHYASLTNLYLSPYTLLTRFSLSNSAIVNLDLSNNLALAQLSLSNNKELSSLNLRNGNNLSLTHISIWGSPNLNCIEVDDTNYSENNWTNVQTLSNFSLDCD